MTPADLKRFRDAKGWSVEQLADQLGSPLTTVRGWLYGARAIPVTVDRIVELLGGMPARAKKTR